MKNQITLTAAPWIIATAMIVSPVFADEAASASASAEAAASTVEAAADSVEEAVDTVQEISKELGIKEEAAAVKEVAATQGTASTQNAASTQPADKQAATDEPADAADPMAAMAEWMATVSPGEHHSKLDVFAGDWDITTHFWMTPGAPPETSTGTSKVKWILDGRFLIEKVNSTVAMPGMEPQEFKGLGLTGYDNAKGEYVSIWTDTMSTAIINASGSFDDSTQTLTLNNSFDCPMEGPCQMRMTLTVVSTDELKLLGFKTPEGGGEETKAMEIIYKRQP